MCCRRRPLAACAGIVCGNKNEMSANIRKSAIFQALGGTTSFLMPTIMLLWRGAGLTFAEITGLQAVFSVILLAFDVPTGWLADKLGRKPALLSAAVLLAGGAAVYSQAQSFAGFLLAEALLGVGLAFASGADQALLYDSLLTLGRQSEFGSIWGKQRAVFLASSAVCCVAGGLAGSRDLRLPCYLELAGALAVLALATFFAEPLRPPHRAGSCQAAPYAQMRAVIAACVVKDAKLRWLFIYPAVLGAFTWIGVWLYQPLFELGGVKVEHYGVLFAVFNLTAALASRYAARIDGRLSARVSLRAPLFVISASYCLMGWIAAEYAIALVTAQQLVRGYILVVFPEKLNRAADSAVRATALSLQSTMLRLLYAALLLPTGMLMDRAGIAATFLVLGVSSLPLGLITLGLLRVKDEG